MSDISESSRVTLIVADFANTDGTGKLNVIGGGVAITAIDSATGHTAPFTVVVAVAIAPKYVGRNFSLELALYRDDGQLVVTPGTPGGPIRIAQAVTVSPVVRAGAYIPEGTAWPATQLIVNFNNGLLLAAGANYNWRVSIDGNFDPQWQAGLYVVGTIPITVG